MKVFLVKKINYLKLSSILERFLGEEGDFVYIILEKQRQIIDKENKIIECRVGFYFKNKKFSGNIYTKSFAVLIFDRQTSTAFRGDQPLDITDKIMASFGVSQEYYNPHWPFHDYEDVSVFDGIGTNLESLLDSLKDANFDWKYYHLFPSPEKLDKWMYAYAIKSKWSLDTTPANEIFYIPYFDKIVEFRIQKKSYISNQWAIIGPNGAGKTTFLQNLTEEILRSRAYKVLYINLAPIKDDYSDKFRFWSERNNNFKFLGYWDIAGKSKAYTQFKKNYRIASMKNMGLMREYFSILKNDSILKEMVKNWDFESTSPKITGNNFYDLSVGHKIVLSILAFIAAESVSNMVLIFDEPENFLHPPLTSALINSIGKITKVSGGISIFATHSPVVIQEISRDNVWQLSIIEGNPFMAHPAIETYGSNLSRILENTFNLEFSDSGFYREIKGLVAKGYSREQIIHELGGSIGDRAAMVLEEYIND